LFFLGIFAAGSFAAQGQAAPAYKALPPVFIGGFFSGIKPDFGTNTIDGVGGFLDIPVWHIVGVEGEMRFGTFHTVNGVKETTYLVGPRVAYPIQRFIPYVKVMIGSGSFTYPFNEGSDHHTVYAFGAGLDYQITERFYIRGDYEKQRWSFGSGTIGPQTLSAGVTYRLFR
jgi:opacity protein-like surface antigen